MAESEGATSIRWRIHLTSPRELVYEAVATDEGRKRFWSEDSVEKDGTVEFTFPNRLAVKGRILERVPPKRFSITYFGESRVTFELADDGRGGTDLTLTETGIPAEWRAENLAGWISVLLALKAAVDFSADLRNHDPNRTWDQGYADN